MRAPVAPTSDDHHLSAALQPGPTARLRWAIGLLTLGALILFALCTWVRLHHADPELFVGDGYFYYSYLPAWWIDHGLDLTKAYQHRPGEAAYWGHLPTATGRPSNPFGIGMAILLSPAFLLARLAAHGRGDGWGIGYQVPVCTLAFLYSLLGVGITFHLLSRFFSRFSASLTALALALGTGWIAYIFCEPNMSHGTSACVVAAFMLALLQLRERPSPARSVLVGALLGLAALVRPQNALLLLMLPPVLGRPRLRIYAALAASALVTFFPQLFVWHAIHGMWLGIPQGEGFIQWTRLHPLPVLFSTNHGLLMWAPLLLFSFAGFPAARSSVRPLAAGCALVLLAELYVNSAVQQWCAGWAFGMRRMVDYLPLFAVGFASLAAVVERRRVSRWSFVLTCAVLVALNACQVCRYYSHELPPVGEVGIRRLWGDVLRFPASRLKQITPGSYGIGVSEAGAPGGACGTITSAVGRSALALRR